MNEATTIPSAGLLWQQDESADPASPARLSRLKVLVIDDQRPMRDALRLSLARLGIDDVIVAGTVRDALRAMRAESGIDLVVCDYYLGPGTDGQQLLEAARSAGLLKPAAPWIFVSASAMRGDVMAAGDFAPDAYLVKPFSDQLLGHNITQACRRKLALEPLLRAAAAKDWDQVLVVAEAFALRDDVLRIEGIRQMAHALMQLGRFDEAHAACDQALELNSELPWARLGRAQAQRAMGQVDEARAAIELLVRRHPDYVAAHDVLLEIAEEQGDEATALAIAATVAERVPNARRQIKLGTVALHAGRPDVAVAALEHAVARNRHSITRSHHEGVLLAQALVDSADPARALVVAEEVAQQFPQREAAQLLSKAVSAQGMQLTGRTEEAAALMQQVAASPALHGLGDADKLLIAKTALGTGHTDMGLALAQSVARNNSDQPLVLAAALRVASGTAAAEECRNIVERAGAQTQALLDELRQAKREGEFLRGIELGERALQLSPQNFTVLIELCTLHLLAASRQEEAAQHGERARELLVRLEALNAQHSRVAAARRFYRERVEFL